MPSQSPIEDLVSALIREGVVTRREQARALDMPYSTFMRQLSRAGLTQERADLSEWMPRRIKVQHLNHPIARKLRHLAQAAVGAETKYQHDRGYAAQWARQLVSQGLDVAYSRSEGWSIRSADTGSWYLKDLLEAASRNIIDMPQLDDLGKDPN